MRLRPDVAVAVYRPAAASLILTLSWEPPYASSAALKRQKKKKKKNRKTPKNQKRKPKKKKKKKKKKKQNKTKLYTQKKKTGVFFKEAIKRTKSILSLFGPLQVQ